MERPTDIIDELAARDWRTTGPDPKDCHEIAEYIEHLEGKLADVKDRHDEAMAIIDAYLDAEGRRGRFDSYENHVLGNKIENIIANWKGQK